MKFDNNKATVVVICLAILALIVLQLYTAKVATNQSEQILNDFNAIDNSLRQSSDSIIKANDSLELKRLQK